MKPCPFCSEQIQDAAIKCRFCGSMLDGSAPHANATPAPGAALALAHVPPAPLAAAGHQGAAPLTTATTIFEGTPSWKAWFWSYVGAYASIVGILVWLPFLHFRRKGVRYHITSRSIEYEVGVLTKRVETLPLWRVLDIELRQSFLERMLGIATINVVTKDGTTPVLALRGLPASREIFEKLRDATEVARQQRVVEVV